MSFDVDPSCDVDIVQLELDEVPAQLRAPLFIDGNALRAARGEGRFDDRNQNKS